MVQLLEDKKANTKLVTWAVMTLVTAVAAGGGGAVLGTEGVEEKARAGHQDMTATVSDMGKQVAVLTATAQWQEKRINRLTELVWDLGRPTDRIEGPPDPVLLEVIPEDLLQEIHAVEEVSEPRPRGKVKKKVSKVQPWEQRVLQDFDKL